MKLEVHFKQERETKGAVRYQEVDSSGKVLTNSTGAVVGTLYIRKTWLSNGAPANLHVTIEDKKDG